jgi:imidazolonepropionase
MDTRGAAVAATMATAAEPPPVRASALAATVTDVDGGAGVAWEDGMIVYAGPAADLPWAPTFGRTDAGALVPGFVDCHVHLPFVGWRDDEFEARLRGISYRELHGREGGIFRSSRLLRESDDEEVLAFCRPLLDEMLASGTTSLELKTGYGLGVEEELRQARLARRLADEGPQTCTVTMLACHAVPEGWDRDAWVRAACEELIPRAAHEGLVDAVDIYVEDIAFSLDDLDAVAAAAAAADLPFRVHADQLGRTGAAARGAELGARSADHLNHTDVAGAAALASAGTVAVLLPASTFFLRARGADVAALRAAGAAIAVATDFNPGTSPVCSMPEAISFASTVYGLAPLEALTAATANPAHVLGLVHAGRLEPGMRADLLLLDAPRVAAIPYRPGHDPVAATIVGGELVAEHGRVLAPR